MAFIGTHFVQAQAWPGVVHDQPSFSIWQVLEQPSPDLPLPSSQFSPPAGTLSPQSVTVQGLPSVAHVQPGSFWQLLEQPSPSAVFPSSHVSSVSSAPSPHLGVVPPSDPPSVPSPDGEEGLPPQPTPTNAMLSSATHDT